MSVKTFAAIALATCLAAAVPAFAQQSYYNSSTGDWSETANWTGGEPGASTDAYIGHASGAADASVTVTATGEACDYLYVGCGEGTNGLLTLNSGSELTGTRMYVGYETTGKVVQNGGTCTVSNLMLGDGEVFNPSWSVEGSYELNGGYLQANYINMGGPMCGSGYFRQTGGQLDTYSMSLVPDILYSADFRFDDGIINNTGGLGLGMGCFFMQYGGVHTVDDNGGGQGSGYYKYGGTLHVTGNICELVGFYNRGGDTVIDGSVLPMDFGVFSAEGGNVEVKGNVIFALDDGFHADLDIKNPGNTLKIGGELAVNDNAEFICSTGSSVEIGTALRNECTTSGYNSDDFYRLAIIFDGESTAATMEAASEDMGAVEEGFNEDNFCHHSLDVGGDTFANLTLVNAFDNQTSWTGTDAMYVESLFVRAGSTLDLNGLNLYYINGQIDPDATILLNGGQLVQVPEPATLSMLGLGAIALLRRKRK